MKYKLSEKYRRWRLIILLTEYISLFGIICMFMLVFCTVFSPEDISLGVDVGYTESRSYVKQVEKEVRELRSYLLLRGNLEEDGLYNQERTVNIEEYAQTGVISGESPKQLAYKLKDLLGWAQTGLGKDEQGLYKEEYLPQSGISILTHTKGNEEQAQKYYTYLENTLSHIQEDVWSYNQYKSKFEKDNSNLSYKVYDYAGGLLYTNTLKSYTQMKEAGTHFLMDYSNLNFDHGLIINENFFEEMRQVISPAFANTKLYIGIDTAFPIKDQFYEMSQRYELWKPWNIVAAIGMGIFGLLWLSSLALWSYWINKAVSEKQDISGPYDKYPYEGVCLLFVGGIVVSCYLAWLSYKYFEFFPGIIGVLFALDGFANGAFLRLYSSTIRRWKTKMLLHNSITIKITFTMAGFLQRRLATVRAVFFYLFVMSSNAFCFIQGGYWRIPIVIFDILIGWILLAHASQELEIKEGMHKIIDGDFDYQLDTRYFMGQNRDVGDAVNIIGGSIREAVDRNIKNERMKTELITNVSHDLRTPLTSIINYVELLKRRGLQDEEAVGYVKVLEDKSQKLRKLTEDLLEISRISSGKVVLERTKINFKELIQQTNGEFVEQFEEKQLQMVVTMPDKPVFVWADSAKTWRIIENIYGNVVKYAMTGTRVFMDVHTEQGQMHFSVKNISEKELKVNPEELIGRFVRGELDRSVEGSGLGLAIAKDLTELHGGGFHLQLDGDLFKVMIRFPIVE